MEPTSFPPNCNVFAPYPTCCPSEFPAGLLRWWMDEHDGNIGASPPTWGPWQNPLNDINTFNLPSRPADMVSPSMGDGNWSCISAITDAMLLYSMVSAQTTEFAVLAFSPPE